MRIFIWDKEYELDLDVDHDWPKFAESHLNAIKALIDKHAPEDKKAYEAACKKIEKGSLADFSDISAADNALLSEFIDYVKGDPNICWPSFYMPIEEVWPGAGDTIAYEQATWDFIDKFARSNICKFNYGEPLEMPEILIYAFCPKLIEVAGRTTMRRLFTDIIRYESPSICGDSTSGYIGELALQKQLSKLVSALQLTINN